MIELRVPAKVRQELGAKDHQSRADGEAIPEVPSWAAR
jgi:hypothetical protein